MLSRDIGIDLGTANVLIYIKGKGIVLNEPSVVVIDTENQKVLAVGQEASEMIGKTPGKIKVIKPMKDGVIADFELTEIMLNMFIKKIKARKLFSKPRILICCPTNITPVEKNAIIEAAKTHNVNAYYIVARILQEQGKDGSTLSKGQGYNGQYVGVYNVFNIGASGNGKETVI